MDKATSAVEVSKFAAIAGKDGSRILSGKKLISEILVTSMKPEKYLGVIFLAISGAGADDMFFTEMSDGVVIFLVGHLFLCSLLLRRYTLLRQKEKLVLQDLVILMRAQFFSRKGRQLTKC